MLKSDSKPRPKGPRAQRCRTPTVGPNQPGVRTHPPIMVTHGSCPSYNRPDYVRPGYDRPCGLHGPATGTDLDHSGDNALNIRI